VTLQDVLNGWSSDNLANLSVLLGGSEQDPTIQDIENRVKWLYHSKSKAKVGLFTNKIYSSLSKEADELSIEEMVSVPTYKELVEEAAKKLKVYVGEPSIAELELFISQDIVVNALKKMSPKDRKVFLSKQIGDTHSKSNPDEADEQHVYTTVALGFVTYAIDASLPSKVYSGVASSIALMMGPPGWLAAGLWKVMSLTKSEWTTLIPAILYIASVNSVNNTMINSESEIENSIR
jgi:uncharacterized protein YaaW (UPF0174 family)